MTKRVSIEEHVASKMEKHHRTRAAHREEARKELQGKVKRQVCSWNINNFTLFNKQKRNTSGD